MHSESMDLMKYFINQYLSETILLRVLDVGSQTVKEQFKKIKFNG